MNLKVRMSQSVATGSPQCEKIENLVIEFISQLTSESLSPMFSMKRRVVYIPDYGLKGLLDCCVSLVLFMNHSKRVDIACAKESGVLIS